MDPSKVLRALLVLAVAGVTWGLGVQRTAALDPALKPGYFVKVIQSGGEDRAYYLHIPDQYDGTKPFPLVFLFHGAGGTGAMADDVAQMTDLSEKEGFIAVYPNGMGPAAGTIPAWNAGKCCGYPAEKNVDDVGFVRTLVQKLCSDLNVDPARIYAAGMSNGGMLCYRLACEAPDLFAAVAPVSASMFDFACSPSAPVSLIAFNGTRDALVPYDGGIGPKAEFKVESKPVPEVIKFWADKNGCTEKDTLRIGHRILREAFKGGKDGTEVVLYTIEGGQHAWPGASRGSRGIYTPTREIKASDTIWEFFKTHPKKR